MQNKKRAVLFANGQIQMSNWLNGYLQSDDYLIAVDGGYEYLKPLDRVPDLLVGDLDSILPQDTHRLQAAGTEVLQYPVDKDETDLELALHLTVEKGFKLIRVIAALGGRIDQTLGNIFLLTSPRLEGCDVRLVSGSEEIFLIRSQVQIVGTPGDTVSLLPIGNPVIGVTTQGLKYPLHAETLYPNKTRGISNSLLAGEAKIQIETGLLLCVHMQMGSKEQFLQ